MNLSRREKVLIGILALIAFIYLFYNFYYTPLNKERERLLDESTATKILIERGVAAHQEKLILERQTKKIEKTYAGLLAEIPSSFHTPETIAYMEANCQEAGVTLLSIKYTPVDKSKGDETGTKNNQTVIIPNNVHETKYTMEVRGNYNPLMNFMARVENAPCFFIIRSCKIMANTDTLSIEPTKSPDTTTAVYALNKSDDIVLSLEFSTYYYADQLKMPTGMESDTVQPGEGRINPYTPASSQ